MNLGQRKVTMKAFIFSQSGYCLLLWMFHSRRLNDRINNIQDRVLQIVYRNRTTSSVQKSYYIFCTEIVLHLLQQKSYYIFCTEIVLHLLNRNRTTSFEELLKNDKSETIHQRNLQIFATEIFKTKNGFNPKIMKKNQFHRTCKSSQR